MYDCITSGFTAAKDVVAEMQQLSVSNIYRLLSTGVNLVVSDLKTFGASRTSGLRDLRREPRSVPEALREQCFDPSKTFGVNRGSRLQDLRREPRSVSTKHAAQITAA